MMLDFINPAKQIGDANKPSVSVHDIDEIANIVATLLAKADVTSGILLESVNFGEDSNHVVTFKTKGFNVNTKAETSEENMFLTIGNIAITYDATSKNITIKSSSPAIHRVNHMWTDINNRKPMEIATVSSVDNPDVKLGDFVILAESSATRPYAFGIVENITSTVMNVLILIETITKYTYGGVLQFEKRQYFPATGEVEFIYVALDNTWAYYWNGTEYVTINPYKLPVSMVQAIAYTIVDNVLNLTITLVDPVTGITNDLTYTYSGSQLVFTHVDNSIIINVKTHHDDTLAGDGTQTEPLKLDKVYIDDTLAGKGTSVEPLKIDQIYHDDVLAGKGTSVEPLKLDQIYHENTLTGKGTSTEPLTINKDKTTVNHDVSMKGTGESTDLLGTDVEVEGSPNYGKMIYAGLNNKEEVQTNAPTSSLPTLVSSTEFTYVILRSKATVANPIPYTPPTLDGIMMFNLPSDRLNQYMRIEFSHLGCWLYDIIETGGTPATRAVEYQLANATNWLPDWQHTCVVKFYSNTSDYDNTWKFIDDGTISDVYKYNTINAHLADNVRHISRSERIKWNKAVEDLATHVGDSTIHVTSTDKTYWNAKIEQSALDAEATARSEKDAVLEAEVQSLHQLGRYLNTVESYNAAKPALMDLTTSDIPAAAKVGDYISVRHDETHNNVVNVWRIQSMDTDTKQITWVWDYSAGIDATIYMTKIPDDKWTTGHIPTMGGDAGLLEGTGIDPTTLALKNDVEAVQNTVWGRYLGEVSGSAAGLPTTATSQKVGDFMFVLDNTDPNNLTYSVYRIFQIAASGAITWGRDFSWSGDSRGGICLGFIPRTADLPTSFDAGMAKVNDIIFATIGPYNTPTIYRIVALSPDPSDPSIEIPHWDNDLMWPISTAYRGAFDGVGQLPTTVDYARVNDTALVRSSDTGLPALYKIAQVSNINQITWAKDFEWPSSGGGKETMFKRRLKITSIHPTNPLNIDPDVIPVEEWCTLLFEDEQAELRVVASVNATSSANCPYLVIYFRSTNIMINSRVCFTQIPYNIVSPSSTLTNENVNLSSTVSSEITYRWIRTFNDVGSLRNTWYQCTENVMMLYNTSTTTIWLSFIHYGTVYKIEIASNKPTSSANSDVDVFIKVSKYDGTIYPTTDVAYRELKV